jgi:hypothetical protein
MCACVCLRALLQSSNAFQQSSEFSTLGEFGKSTRRAIIASTNKRAPNPNGRNRRASDQIGHFGPNGLAVGIAVQFHYRVFYTSRVQQLLGLDTKGSGSKAQHEDGIVVNQTLDAGLDRRLIVVASEGLDEGFLAFVQEAKQVDLSQRSTRSSSTEGSGNESISGSREEKKEGQRCGERNRRGSEHHGRRRLSDKVTVNDDDDDFSQHNIANTRAAEPSWTRIHQ